MNPPAKPFVCKQCHQSFFGKDPRTGNPTSRYPLILSCGHSSCLLCLKSAARNHKYFKCPSCQKETPLPDGETSVQELLPDLHILGVLSLSKPITVSGVREILKHNIFPAGAENRVKPKPAKPILNGVSSTVTCEDCGLLAEWWCKQCQMHFCVRCYDKAHRISKALKKHKVLPLHAQEYRTIAQKSCLVHDQSPLEFFCEDDQELVCTTCVVQGTHKGHMCLSLVQKNEACIPELKLAFNDAKSVRARMKQSLKKMDELKPTILFDLPTKEQDIRDYFHHLHASLQLRESALVQQLHEYGRCNQTQHESMAEEISRNIKEISAHLNDAEVMLQHNYFDFNGASLINKLKSAKTLPSFIVPTGEPESSLNVHLNQKLLPHLLQAGSIEADIRPRYQVVPEDNLPLDFVKGVITEEVITDTESSPSLNGSATEVVITPNEINGKATKFRFITPKHTKLLRHEYAKVVHIVDPGCFFVQYCSEIGHFRTLMENIQRFCRNCNDVGDILTTISEGVMYLVQYEDSKWYRAKVDKVLDWSSLDEPLKGIYSPCSSPKASKETTSLDSNPEAVIQGDTLASSVATKGGPQEDYVPLKTSLSSEQIEKIDWASMMDEEERVTVMPDQLVRVTYMDFGNTDMVPVYKIRAIPSKFMSHSFFAHECCLWEVQPAEPSVCWSKEAVNVFCKFVDKQKLLLSIIEEHGGVLFVDINQPAHYDVSNDTPVSVREALIFMEYAVYPNNGTLRDPDRKNHNRFFPAEPIQPGEKVNVLVTHVDNPSDFYVMMQGSLSRYFLNMTSELQKHYSGIEGDLLAVYAPRVGHPYVALFPEDEKWYRAEVEELIGGCQVRVKFVDFGNSCVVLHWNLRKIVDTFIKFPIQSIRCVMADVLPAQQKWDGSSTDWLKKETCSNLQMMVHKRSSGDMHVVSLFKLGVDTDTCLNALIVQEGFARTTGPGSVIVNVPKAIMATPPPLQQDYRHEPLIDRISRHNMTTNQPTPKPTNKKNTEKKIPQIAPVSPSVRAKTKLEVLRETPNQVAPVPVVTPITKEVLLDRAKAKLIKTKRKKPGTPVKIIKFDNPGCFHTMSIEDEPELRKLMKELAKYHESGEACEKVDLKVGTFVSAFNSENGSSSRAKILQVFRERKTVQVNLLDYADVIEVPECNLKPLPPAFRRCLVFTTRCHLVGLIPAGGKTWTRTATEFAQMKIAEYKELFLVLKVEPDKKGVEEMNVSAPVDIIMKQIIPGGALESNLVKHDSLTEILIDNGYAFSERKFNRHNTKDIQPEPKLTLEVKGEEDEAKVPSQLVEEELKDIEPLPCDIKEDPVEENESLLGVLEELEAADNVATPSDPSVLRSDVDIDWLPAVLPIKHSFMAYPTYVDYDGCLYLHGNEEAHETLSNISASLSTIFEKDCYKKPMQVIKIGQICVAKYCQDNKWYRGKIHKVLDNCVEVIFVDYGNMELVLFENIRLFATHLDIPIQGHECEIHNVRPISDNGQWPISTLDFIHKTIVEKLVLVTVKETIDSSKRLKVSITLTGGDTITDLLVKENLAHVVQPNMMLLSGAIANPYRNLPNPILGCTFRVVVTHMIDPSLVCVQRPKTEKPADNVDALVNQELNFFLAMLPQLAETAQTQPPLRFPAAGMPCLGQYSFDGDWYRCIVTDCDDTLATVVFIDYGNSERIPLSSKRLRVIPKELMKVAAQAMTCRLHGIVSPDGEWSLPAHKAMSSLLFPSQDYSQEVNELTAQVMDIGTPIEIIITEQGDSSQPIYQYLIDERILATRI